jgi:capsular polysaccharide transport system ATP-binding protein
MITLTDVSKRYVTPQRGENWVLRGVSLRFPPKCNVAVFGATGSGKTTLLRLLAGIERPTRGQIRRESRVSWPVGTTAGLQKLLTGRQNTRFICRVEGFDGPELEERIRAVHEFSELGAAFDEPLENYSAIMRAQLSFSLSVAFEFDVYLVDQRAGAGRDAFKVKSRDAVEYLAQRANLIVATQGRRSLASLCQAGVVLHEGQAYWYDSVREARREHIRRRRG